MAKNIEKVLKFCSVAKQKKIQNPKQIKPKPI